MEKHNYAPFYALMYPRLRDRARELGYALAVHGSLAKDLDVIAVPWVEDAASESELVEALAEVCGKTVPSVGFEPTCWQHTTEPAEKPHGRTAWSLSFGGDVWVDLSIISHRVDSRAMTRKERDDDQVLAERDRAEEALSRAYQIVVGKEPEWSNHFGHKDAIEDIENAVYDLKQSSRNATTDKEQER